MKLGIRRNQLYKWKEHRPLTNNINNKHETINMKQTYKILLLLEVLLCFGPVTLFLFQGILIVIVFAIKAILDGQSDYFFITSMLRILGGVFGLIGIIHLTRIIILKRINNIKRRRILFFILCGIFAIAQPIFNGLYNGADFNLNKDVPLLLMLTLPLISTFHLIYLGRKYLFLKPSIR